MRRSLWGLAFALLVLLPAGLAGQEGAVVFRVRESAAPCLVFRALPSAGAARQDCLAPGTVADGIGTAPYWRQIRLGDGRTGWAAKKFLELVGEPAGPPASIPDAWLEVHVVDVGQGDGIWIHTYDDGIPGNGIYEGRNIIIDGGPDASDARDALLRYVLARAHEHAVVDALILTHPHDDHYPGAEGILRHFEVRNYYDPGYPKEGARYAGFLAMVRAESALGAPTVMHMGRASFGTLDWGSELQVQVLYSYPGSPEGLGSGNTLENNASIVLRLVYGTQSILLMGDAEGKDRDDPPDSARYGERILLDSVGAAGLHSTVLKIAHHGSETSSTLPFIQAVDPSFVVVSSGRKSFHGSFLPDSTTLARYCAHNPAIRIYRTDQGDAEQGRTPATDADGDDVLIRTNGTVTLVDGLADGVPVHSTACVP